MLPAPIVAFFAKPIVKYGLPVLALAGIAVTVWWVLDAEYGKGAAAGKAVVTNAVQADTIKKTDDAVKAKDKADDEVHKTPYSDLVNNL